MNLITQIKSTFISTVSYLYVFLFTYAAVSKWLEFDKFLIQVGQSPLLSAFAGWLVIIVPVIELVIAVLLLLPRFRKIALLLSYALMVMFTAYIFLVLYYSSHVPCSCGGILENMGWTEHLYFNAGFIILALVAYLLQSSLVSETKPVQQLLIIAGTGFAGFLIVLVLYLVSEEKMHARNPFIRRFEFHARPEDSLVDLKVNSYYFSGKGNGKVYLGNSTAPLTMTVIDTVTLASEVVRIALDSADFKFQSVQVRVAPPYFYVTDGTVPCIYKGDTQTWKATLQPGRIRQFTLAEPVNRQSLAVRITSPARSSNILGSYSLHDSLVLQTNPKLLTTQSDGIFDTDGMLLYNDHLSKLIYVYYYRNQYLSVSTNLQLMGTGKTIDTVSTAQLTVKHRPGETQMTSPPLVVNRRAATYNNLLFINSERVGKYESRSMVGQASVIDCYNLTTGHYLSSLYVYHVKGHKMSSFLVYGDKLYTLSGNYLTVLNLDNNITKHYTKATRYTDQYQGKAENLQTE